MDFLPSVGASQSAASPPAARRLQARISFTAGPRRSSPASDRFGAPSLAPPSLLAPPEEQTGARLKFPLLSALWNLFVEVTRAEARYPTAQVSRSSGGVCGCDRLRSVGLFGVGRCVVR